MTEPHAETTFLSPFDVPTPEGAEGWEEMYPYYLLFDPERREAEEKRFWFYNGMHFPEPMPAFDMITAESCYLSIGLYQGRVFQIPTVLGIEHRVVNGYVYITSNEVSDPAEIEKRLEVFLPRIGFYYQNWDMLVARWQAAVDSAIAELTALEVPRLPELEDEQELLHDHKLGSNFRLMTAYDRCIGLYNELNQLHFELLLLAYGAYLTFFQFCQGAFPDMGMQVMTQMVAGYDTTMFRPDDELKALASAAIAHGVDGSFADGRTPDEVLAELEGSEAGRAWIADLEARKHPWFFMSTGDGFYHHHRAWVDDLRLPFTAITGYIAQIRAGTSLDRPEGAAARRARPDRRRVRAAAGDARGARVVRGDARPLPPRLPARRGAQVLHRALGHLAVLQQDARDRRRDGRARLLRERRRRLLPQHPRGARGALRPRARLVGRRRRARHGLLAAAGRAAQGDPRAARRVDAAAGARRRARGDHRPDRAAAVGRHRRSPARVGRARPRTRTSAATPPRRASSRASHASSATSTRSARCSRARCSCAR